VAGVTRQVLAFSDPGRLAKGPLDLRRPLAEAADFVRRHPAFAAVSLRLTQPPEPLRVVGNATTLGQLFLNLLLNAAQCQASAGEVEVVCREGPAGRAVVSIADRGPGLSGEAQRHLFEPFFSTRGSTGLGLAACHGIARDHQGVLTGGNRAGGGAIFALELPLAGGEPATAETPDRGAEAEPEAGTVVVAAASPAPLPGGRR
jgi:two-component system C4-dicarboxylate transport sensor histidine kinase DctB